MRTTRTLALGMAIGLSTINLGNTGNILWMIPVVLFTIAGTAWILYLKKMEG